MTTPDGMPLSFGLSDDQNLVEWQRHYHLDDEPIAEGLTSQVDPIFADLLDVAVAVYVSDRMTPRRPKYKPKDGRYWGRSMRLKVAVRERSKWIEPSTDAALRRLLGWLTDDRWEIEFVAGPKIRRISETQTRLFVDALDRPMQVALFSGGLDSLLGAAADARESDGELVLVGAGTHSRMIGKQRELVRGLEGLVSRKIRSVIVPINLTAEGKAMGSGQESSQRSRGFVFLSLGAAVANAAGGNELRVHENGPGALNLPLTLAQRGSMNTRAARPETLALMSDLVTRLTGQAFEVRNPAFWATKAEMCLKASPEIHDLMTHSVTCDGALTRREKTPLCGTCTSCLLRRQALLASDLDHVDGADLARMNGDGLAARRENANPMVLAMLQQARQINLAVSADDPWGALLARFPELGAARRSLGVEPSMVVDLLARYAADWKRLRYPLTREFLGSPPRGGYGA
jgi:7-cyano-7-deazaguanine synthase in queuosine biosynthesis